MRYHRRRLLQPRDTCVPGGVRRCFFFADYCQGWIRAYDPTTKTVSPFRCSASFAEKPVDLQVGNDGNLYVFARVIGSVEKITHSSN